MQCFCGNSSVGRASASQAEGRGFESRFPLKRTPEMRASQQRCLFLCVASPGSLLTGRKTHKKNHGQQSCPALILPILLKAPPRRAGREWRSLNPADARNAQPAGRAQSRRVGGNGGGQIPRRAGREWRSLNPADARNAQPAGRAQSRRGGGNAGGQIPLPPKTAASAATLP